MEVAIDGVKDVEKSFEDFEKAKIVLKEKSQVPQYLSKPIHWKLNAVIDL